MVTQLTLFYDEKSIRADARQVQKALTKMRQIHDELNAGLATNRQDAPTIHSPTDAADLVLHEMSIMDHEELFVIVCNTRNRVLSIQRLYQGTINSSHVRVGELFRAAILANAASIVVCHNHPSGDPTPSPEDVGLTRAIVQAGKLLDIDVLDHLVIAAGRYVSLKERGLGFS